MRKNILVVDDSALMRRVICDIINADGTFQVTDVCRNGLEAYEKIKTTKYDGIILDVNMPVMGGLELLERMQKEGIHVTVIMVSAMTAKEARVTILGMEQGAIDFVTKPESALGSKGETFKKQLLDVLSAVLKPEKTCQSEDREKNVLKKEIVKTISHGKSEKSFDSCGKIVVLASSTGGPKALQSVIPQLPQNLDVPVVVIQHMPAGFTKSMAERLNEISSISVKEAEDGEALRKGRVYIAPGGKHLEIQKSPEGMHKIKLNDMPPIGRLRPCANVAYESLRKCNYQEVICVVLTGMGADGTSGILSLSQSKPVYVISQSAETCVVYGMPRAIAEAGLVDEVVPLTQIAQSIIKNVRVQ